MKVKQSVFLFSIAVIITACGAGSIKNTIKNIDNNAPIPVLRKDNSFVVTEYSTNPKYGYDKDYPINVFYKTVTNEAINQERFLKSLAGPNGEKLFYKRLESCCPFSTKQSKIGAGFLDIYEIRWVGCKKPLTLYFNIYEKGQLLVPVGLTAKKAE